MKTSVGIKYKILSLILAISLMLGSIVLSSAANGNDIQNTEPQNGSAVDTSLTNYLPMVLDSSFFHIYWTGLSGTEKVEAKGHIAEGLGVDGSNALRFGKEGIDFTYYETSLKFHQKSCLESNTKYVVKMMLKVETGSITQIKLGMMDNSNAGLNYVKTLSDTELSAVASDWTEVEFEYTPVYEVASQWSSVSFNLKTGTEGGTLLLDNLVVYKKADSTQTNLFTRGSFDGSVRYGEYDNDENEISHYLPFTVPSEKEFPYIYWHGLSADNAEKAKVRLAKNEGVNGTHAVRIGATGFPITYYETTFKFPATSLLETGEKYIISVKLKKDAGDITSLSVGMLDNGTNATSVYDCNLESKYVTDSWTTFEWEYTPTYQVTGQWSSVAFKLKTGDNGGTVLIDDILVCRADDPTRRNIFYKGSFDSTVSMESIEETGSPDGEYLPVYVSGNRTHIYWTDLTGDSKTAAMPRTENKIGYNKTAGMKIGAESIATGYYEASLKFPKTGALESDTKYIVEFKARKGAGNITNMKVGMLDNGVDAKIVYPCEFKEDLISENWSRYSFEYTPTYNVDAQWSSIAFNIKTDSIGGYMIIDDIVVYRADDTEKKNIFDYGTFDTDVLKSKPQETETEESKTLPLDVSGNMTHIYWSNLTGEDYNAAKPRTEKGIGFNKTSGMKIGAEGMAITYYEASLKFPELNSLKADTEYIISFKVKTDKGSVMNFKAGVFDNGDDAKPIYPCDLAGVYLDDTWSEFTFKYMPTYKVEDQWSSIAFNIVTGADGGVLIIDDILVYDEDDADHANIFWKGSFDTTVSMESVEITDSSTSEYLPVYVSGSKTHIYWTDLKDDNKTAAMPRTEKEIGFNKTAGMIIGAEDVATGYYEASLKFPKIGALESNTKYIVEFKAKKGVGNITGMKVGVLDNGQDAKFVYACELTAEYITEDWALYKFEYIPTYEVAGQWSSVAFNIKTDSLGGSLIIDDIAVYKADDNEKKDIFQYGSFDTEVLKNKVEETATAESDNLPLDISGDSTHIYWTDLSENDKNAARPRTEIGIGFNKTAGMKIGVEGIKISYYEASIKFPQKSSLKADTEYVVRFKAKTDKGTVENLKVGMFDNGGDAKVIYPCDLAGEYIDSTWSEFIFKYTPTYNVDAQWSSVAFNIVTGEEGGTLIIDDILVYEANDPEMKNIFTDGTFDSDCKRYEVTETPTTEKIVPVEIYDYTDKSSSQSGAIPRYYWNEDYRNEIRPVSVKGGVNGTNALQLGGAYGPIKYYGIGFYHTNRGTWKNNTEYVVSIKIKKTQGNLNYLKMGYGDPETKTVLSLSDSYITNEWTEFVWSFTTGDKANDPKSDNLINLSFSAPAGGVTILVDDFKIYRADDPEKKDFFYKGSFDYVDKGQEPVKWNTGVSENIIPVFGSDYNKDYNVTDEQKAQGDTGVIARVVNCDTPSGDYCLALGFDENRGTNNEVYITLQSTKSGGKYKFGFWVKVVGEVYNAQVGMVEGDYSFESCGNGYTFNQYEHGKWTYHEFIVEDTGTFMTNKSYRRFCVRLNAPAGSGMLIDGVTVTDVDHPDPLNYMYFGDFEKSTVIPQIDWKKDERFIYKEENK